MFKKYRDKGRKLIGMYILGWHESLWTKGYLKGELKTVLEELEEVKKSRDRTKEQLDRVGEVLQLAYKTCFAGTFTRQEIADMSVEDFLENEERIDEELRDGKTFLN
jgi:hypothetical protein